jgi:hypothetical protein
MHGAARQRLPDAVPAAGRNDAVVASVGIDLPTVLTFKEKLVGMFGRPRGGILGPVPQRVIFGSQTRDGATWPS